MQNDDEKENLICLLNDYTEENIKEIYFDNIIYFKNIEEYCFYIINFIAINGNNQKMNIFLKEVKKGKIKESVFCICDEFYTRYCKNTNTKNILELQKKIKIIEERKTAREINKVSIHFFDENRYSSKAKLEISFVDISKIIKNKKKGWVKYLETSQDTILLIGVLKN